MFRIYKKIEISASHTLRGNVKCRQMHGHNYVVELWAESETLSVASMVIDFHALKEGVELLDHKHLNDLIEEPTAEAMAFHLFRTIPLLMKVRVWETSDSYAEYEKSV